MHEVKWCASAFVFLVTTTVGNVGEAQAVVVGLRSTQTSTFTYNESRTDVAWQPRSAVTQAALATAKRGYISRFLLRFLLSSSITQGRKDERASSLD